MDTKQGKRGRPYPKRAVTNSLETADDIDTRAWETFPEIQTAVRNYQRFLASLSDAERAKLRTLRKKLVNDAEKKRGSFNSDSDADLLLEKHIDEAREDRQLFEEWWKVTVPLLSCDIRFNETLSLVWAKIAPGVVQGDPLPQAKLAAQDTKTHADRIRSEAERGNKRFFIELGKCLSGEIKPELCDKIDTQILRILCVDPSIPAKDALRKLRQKGWHMTEENFRMRKQRLKRAILEGRKAYDQSNKA